MTILKKCKKCKKYTLNDKCKKCDSPTIDAHYKFIKLRDEAEIHPKN